LGFQPPCYISCKSRCPPRAYHNTHYSPGKPSWNSAIFASFGYVSYPRAMVTSDFLEVSDDWSISNLPAIQSRCWNGAELDNIYQNVSSIYSLRTAAENFTRLEKRACMENFINSLNVTRPLVVVLNVTSAQNNGSSITYGGLSGCWDVWSRSSFWICSAYLEHSYKWCTSDWANSFVDQWVVMETWDYSNSPKALIEYCLVGDPGDNSQKCAIHYNTYLLSIVCVCTCLESLLIFWTSRSQDAWETMLTVGDAICDFLKKPDIPEVGVTEMRWEPKKRISWFKVISIQIWIISLVM
jgi:hypothetical protein